MRRIVGDATYRGRIEVAEDKCAQVAECMALDSTLYLGP